MSVQAPHRKPHHVESRTLLQDPEEKNSEVLIPTLITTQINSEEDEEERVNQLVPEALTPTREAFAQRLKNEANFSSPMAHVAVKAQARCPGNPFLMAVLPSSETHPYQTFITPQSVRTVSRMLGKGAQGSVVATLRLFKDPVREQEEEALKIYQRRPSSWELFSTFDEQDKRYINLPIEDYILEDGRYAAVLPKAEADFSQINLLNEILPIQRMFGWMRDVAEGVAIMHDKGILHRDIKPQNILILEERETAQVADLDLAIRREGSEHFTICTPFYSHPSIWGGDIMKQKMRRGVQTPADDVFSLGRTFQYGLITKIFLANPETIGFANAMRPEKITLPEDEAEADKVLQELATFRPGPVIISDYRRIEDPRALRGNRYIPSKVDVFLPSDRLRTLTLQGVEALKEKLDPIEFEALRLSADWAHQLQHDDPSMRPTMRDVQIGIQQGQNNLLQPVNIVAKKVVSASSGHFSQKRTKSYPIENVEPFFQNLQNSEDHRDREVKRAKTTKKTKSLV